MGRDTGKLQGIKTSTFSYYPKKMTDKLGWQKGQKVSYELMPDGIMVRCKKAASAAIEPPKTDNSGSVGGEVSNSGDVNGI